MSGLLHAFYWMDEGLQNHLRAAGMPAVSRTQSLIMTNVADGVTRPAELARRLGISRQAVQQLLADLQTRGLIALVADPRSEEHTPELQSLMRISYAVFCFKKKRR